MPSLLRRRPVVLLGVGAVLLLLLHAWVELVLEREALAAQVRARASVEAATDFRRAVLASYAGLLEWHLAVREERREREAQLRGLLVALEASGAELAPSAGAVPGLEEPRLRRLLEDTAALAQSARQELALGGAALPLESLRARWEALGAQADARVAACVRAGGALDRHLASVRRRDTALNAGVLLLEALALFAGLSWWSRRLRLQRRVNAAEQGRAELRQMAASVAHEVNNQLGVLQNTLELARRGAPARELLPFQQESFEQIRRLAADLVTFSGSQDGERSRFDLAELAHGVARGLEAAPGAVTVHAEGPLWLWADKTALARALLNLMKNGVEAGGPVELRVERAQGGLRVRCLDRGAGLPAEHAARLGSPFFSTKARGTGLGLAIIQRVATAHGGRFLLANREGRGAVAELWLPPGPAFEREELTGELPRARDRAL
ncbi:MULTISPECIES: ATP-binding protein [Myxococcaceae]|uniref:sensor histidine kinase n=1 Tax=Myxococcaceae TaxID=31 RepID=UPI001E4971FB|nr:MULTISPECIES: ATP-binding protein [Myxococcaceae]